MSTGEKKKEKNTRKSVAQKRGDAKGHQVVINVLEKVTLGVPDVKSSRSSKRTRSGLGGNSTNRMKNTIMDAGNLDHSSQNEPALGQARTGTLHQQQRAGLRPCLRLGYKMTLTAIFLQFFFAYTVTITNHFGPNYVLRYVL